MYPDSVSRVHFLFVLIYGKSGFFIKFVKTYSISIKMGEHICFRRNERLATVNPYWRGNPMVRGRFFNRQHRFRPGMGSVLKWRLSPNPQREVGSEGLLSSFAGCRSGRFVDMAGA